MCIGEQFALHRLLLFTANCVQHFNFKPPHGTDIVPCDPRNFKLGLALKVPSYKNQACAKMQGNEFNVSKVQSDNWADCM